MQPRRQAERLNTNSSNPAFVDFDWHNNHLHFDGCIDGSQMLVHSTPKYCDSRRAVPDGRKFFGGLTWISNITSYSPRRDREERSTNGIIQTQAHAERYHEEL